MIYLIGLKRLNLFDSRRFQKGFAGLLICYVYKNIERYTAHTIVTWPNPKQYII